jgi:peptidoglycan-associated lipoprotein
MQPILFDYDKADIRDSETLKLQTAAAFLKSNPSVRLTVEGHCDERGSEQYQSGSGRAPANAVKQFFLSQGIADTRISTISYGEERPVCTDQTEDCFAKNRRAAFAKN